MTYLRLVTALTDIDHGRRRLPQFEAALLAQYPVLSGSLYSVVYLDVGNTTKQESVHICLLLQGKRTDDVMDCLEKMIPDGSWLETQHAHVFREAMHIEYGIKVSPPSTFASPLECKWMFLGDDTASSKRKAVAIATAPVEKKVKETTEVERLVEERTESLENYFKVLKESEKWMAQAKAANAQLKNTCKHENVDEDNGGDGGHGVDTICKKCRYQNFPLDPEP